jgi:hypothetical protein
VLLLGDSHKMKLNQTMTVCARQVMSQIGYVTRDIIQVNEWNPADPVIVFGSIMHPSPLPSTHIHCINSKSI